MLQAFRPWPATLTTLERRSPRARATLLLQSLLKFMLALVAGGVPQLLIAAPAQVAYIGSDHSLVILNRGQRADFREDQAVCFYQKLADDADEDPKAKAHACGVVILATQDNAVVVVDRQFAKRVAKGQAAQRVKRIPPEFAGGELIKKAQADAKGRAGRRVPDLKVEFVAKDESFCLIKRRAELNVRKGMRVCFKDAPPGATEALCSEVTLVNNSYIVVKLEPRLAGKVKAGMVVELDQASVAEALLADPKPSNEAGSKGGSEGAQASPAGNEQAAAAVKDAAVASAKQLRDKNEEISSLKKKNRQLSDEINAKPIPIRLGLYTSMAAVASSSFAAVGFKTVKASESSRATLWDVGQKISQQQPGLGVALQAELSELWYGVGMVDYKSFAMIRRTSLADEFNASTLAHVTTKAYSLGVAGGVLARLFKALQGRFEIGLYATIDRLYFSFAAELHNPQEETSAVLARFGETRDTFGLALPFGVAWTYQRYMGNLHLSLGMPLAVRTVNGDQRVYTSSFIKLSSDGKADLRQALNLQKAPFSVTISAGVFL